MSFAVWYEYVAGINPALVAEAGSAAHGGARLDDDAIYSVPEKHIAEIDEAAAQRISSKMQRIVDGVVSSRPRPATGRRASAGRRSRARPSAADRATARWKG
ncbi:MAG: hypothetical protein MZW92_29520 [Comamonadaceae bacterium]|nr:hypothetical protein [Comamonadaceae bacterium]